MVPEGLEVGNLKLVKEIFIIFALSSYILSAFTGKANIIPTVLWICLNFSDFVFKFCISVLLETAMYSSRF